MLLIALTINKIYGFLLEHIYHSLSNGLWGENVWNRSFEERPAYGDWTVRSNNHLILAAENSPGDFRIGHGKDYTLTLDIQAEGDGTVLLGMRDQNRERMLTNRYTWVQKMGR